jgi:hypothetical protein
MPTSQAFDPSIAIIIGAAVGALAALVGTFVTLLVTRWLDDRRWRREREHREVVERRAAYAKMRRTLVVWREATVDLIGRPKKEDWDRYWAAREDAMEAGAELEMIGSALAIETVSEALDQLLDVWWDYENNGPWAVESGPLWSRMAYIDARLDAFRDLARAEFGLEPATEDPRMWLETPELVRRRAEELQKSGARRRPIRTPESEADARARLDFEDRMHRVRRTGTLRRLELKEGISEAEGNRLLDAWEAEATSRRIPREASEYWRQADEWMARQRTVESRATPDERPIPDVGTRSGDTIARVEE